MSGAKTAIVRRCAARVRTVWGRTFGGAGATLTTLGALAGPACAADYFAGKTVDIVVGGSAGGGIDLYARAVGRHIYRHIPGTPGVVIKNMPGASGTRVAQYVAAGAPNNGLTIGATTPGAIVAPLLDGKTSEALDPSKFIYLGTSNVGVSVCVTMGGSKVKSLADLSRHKAVFGGQGPGAPSFDIAYLVQRTTGAPFSLVSGYNGATHLVLAMERGEIEGVCGLNWSGLRSQKPDWVREGKLSILAQVGIKEDAELSRAGVPTIWNFIPDPEQRRVAEFVLTQKGFERPLLVRSGTPAEIVTLLRAAFDATMKDPQFLADAEKAALEISPASGEAVQKLVQDFYATPKDIVDKARMAIRP